MAAQTTRHSNASGSHQAARRTGPGKHQTAPEGEGMTDIADLERRVNALEAAQNDTTQTLRWVVSKLGTIAAVQQEHTLRLDRIDGRLDRVEGELKGLRSDLPLIVADTMREVLKEHKA